MQVIVSDKELVNLPDTPSRSSTSSPSPSTTPSFTPNSPAPDLPSSALAVTAIISMLSNTPEGEALGEVDEMDIPEDLDLSLPISTLLKVGTMRAHVKAEHSEGAKMLVQGGLGLEEYVRWLAVLWRIYSALELGLQEHSTDSILAPTYDPALLSRAPAIAADINHLLTLLPPSTAPLTTPASPPEPATPLPPFAIPLVLQPVFDRAPPPLSAYINHLRDLASASSSAPSLMAHSYVRYLGDLSGGQYIGARVKKAYKLDGLDGTRFYHFDWGTGEAEGETAAEHKRRLGEVKDWFRRGMDQGVGDDEQLKAHLVKEANLAFALNTHLFSLIRPSLSSSLVPRKTPAKPQRELRYYERREIERKQREAQKLLTNGPEIPNTWGQMIEKFVLFGIAAVLGGVLSQVVIPYVIKYVGRIGGGGGGRGGEL